LVAVSVLLSPLTQQLWTWDRFLHGGQDFETAAFLMLISFCLVGVLARCSRRCLEHIFTVLQTSVPAGSRRPGLAGVRAGLLLFARGASGTCRAAFNHPLQI
jgi:hypothetical protein